MLIFLFCLETIRAMNEVFEEDCCSNNSFICCLLLGLGKVFEKFDLRDGMGPPVEAATALLEAVVAARLVPPPPPPRSLLRGCEIPLLKPYLVVPKS